MIIINKYETLEIYENNEEFDLGYIEDCFVEFKDNSEYDFEMKKVNIIISISIYYQSH
jgi:hypothetical protein